MSDSSPETELEIANGSYLQYLETGDDCYIDNLKPDEMRAFIRDLAGRDRRANAARPGRGGDVLVDAICSVVLDLIEHFGDLDDSEEAVFGEYARVRLHADGRGLTVLHQSEPWGISVVLSAVREG